jgi:hypothetical protein
VVSTKITCANYRLHHLVRYFPDPVEVSISSQSPTDFPLSSSSFNPISPHARTTIHPLSTLYPLSGGGTGGVVVWSSYDGMHGPLTRVVRAGTLDEPRVLRPDAHIFVESKLP